VVRFVDAMVDPAKIDALRTTLGESKPTIVARRSRRRAPRFRLSKPDGGRHLAMTSAASRIVRQTTFSAPRRLTPLEIGSSRAHKKELHRRFREIDARQATERTMTDKATESQAAEKAAAE
jgi:hypothetical protein